MLIRSLLSQSPARRKMTRPALALSALCAAFLLAPRGAHAQSYLTQVGNTPFLTALPVEMGYYDASTGNLHIEIPLGSWSQRGKYQLSEVLAYDSRIWAPEGSWQPNNVPGTTWGGWRLLTSPAMGGSSGHRLQKISCGDPGQVYIVYSNFTWLDPQGTLHSFPISTQNDPNYCNGGSNPSD